MVGDGVSAAQLGAEVTVEQELLPISNIMLQESQELASLQCGKTSTSCKDDSDCCLGYNCAATFFNLRGSCVACGIATEACYLTRSCCNGFRCDITFPHTVGTCYKE
uniref:Uncharacterized protein n=1 Tax=Chenopodium quinoa TaxID=63459 RepID=A0A803MH17_CHEQI